MASNKLLLFLGIVLWSGCNIKKENDPDIDNTSLVLSNSSELMPLGDFIKWVGNSDNKLIKNKELNEVNYILSFMPAQALAQIELKGISYTGDQFNQALKNYSGMSYFNLRIERPKDSGELLKYDLKSAKQYTERVSYLSFGMQKDLVLVQGNDTIHPGLYHFERTFEVAPYTTVMLAFDNNLFNKEKEFTIVYDDHLFNKGFIKYTYNDNQLIDLPQISGI